MTNRRAIPASALVTMYPALDEATSLTYRGVTIGTFLPATAPNESARSGRGVSAYKPEPTTEMELAKLAMEVALALSDLESLRDAVRPDPTGASRGPAREAAYLRARIHFARLREQHAKENPE